jgi:ABC-type glycerol-3-phosphate transport system substrate-binding protein
MKSTTAVAAVGVMTLVTALAAGPAAAGPACAKPVQVQGFETCADINAAKKEGKVVLYAVAGQDQQMAVLNEFNKLFPEIKVQSLWAQTGSLYTKVKQEIQTNNTLVDVISLSDPTLLMAMQKANDLSLYESPELKHYPDPNVQSTPKGYWTSWGLVATAIVYNTKTIGANPPTTWKDSRIRPPVFSSRNGRPWPMLTDPSTGPAGSALCGRWHSTRSRSSSTASSAARTSSRSTVRSQEQCSTSPKVPR